MQYKIVVNPENLEFFTYYQSYSAPPDPMFLQMQSDFVTIETSEDPETAFASKNPETGEITIARDPVKFDAKVAKRMGPIREKRVVLLQASDYTQFPDVQEKLSEEERITWKVYRQALRDVPNAIVDLDAPVTWPVAPW